MTIRAFIECLVIVAAVLVSCCAAADDKATYLRGAAVQLAWEKPLQPRIEQVGVREALATLCEGRQLAWLLDRRIDPDRPVSYVAGPAPLSTVVESLLKPLDAQVVRIGDTFVVGPRDSIQWLRTLAELQRLDLLRSGLALDKISQLSRPVIWNWGDLAQPRQIVAEETRRLRLTIEEIDRVPYDLWGRGSLAGMTLGEAVTVIAWQYDCRLHWGENGAAKLVPIQYPIQVSRVLPNYSLDRDAVTEEFPNLHLEPQGKSLEARGRIEEIEALQRWMKGTTADRTKRKPMKNDWRSRKFTLNFENAPLIDLLKLLKQQGLPVEWDEAGFAAASVDLKQKVNLKLTDATAEVLIEDLCRQTGLKSDADSSRVVISP